MSPSDLQDWLEAHSGPDFTWFAKRLSGNDTRANRSHQAGPYIPKDVLFRMFSKLNRPEAENPRVWFDLHVDSHPDSRKVKAIWYNNRLRGGTRNETRITNWGGAQSALLDPESTGSLCLFAFRVNDDGVATACHVWVCRHETEEDIVESQIGPLEPGRWLVWPSGHDVLPGSTGARASCWLNRDEIPPAWVQQFPAPGEIIAKAMELRPDSHLEVDRRLLRRRDCEHEIFRSVEEAWGMQRVQSGFANMRTFTPFAQEVLQRRRVRSGLSLELHTRTIFREEGLVENRDFAYNKRSEGGKRPDFLFPSAEAYRRSDFPASRLRMLAVKTTCKDRWRQILNEADRVNHKHLLTLQEGVSLTQFREMNDANVQLVIPRPLIGKFPNAVQPHLQTLESFIADVRLLKF